MAAIMGAFWLPLLFRGFWLDETGTVWVIQDGMPDAIERSQFQGQSPAYYLLLWAISRVMGTSELALRLPSIMAMAISVVLVVIIGRELFDRAAGYYAGFLFGVSAGVVFAAVDARPYAIALAAFLGSTLALIRWAETRRARHGSTWVILGALTLYLSYTFAFVFLIHAVYILVHPKRRALSRPSILGIIVIVLLLIPSLPHLRAVLSRPDILTFGASGPPFRRLLTTLFPMSALGAITVAVVYAGLRGRARIGAATASRQTLALAATWWLVPTVALFALSWALTPKFFQDRYLLGAAAGLALMFGLIVRQIGTHRVQIMAVAIAVLLSAATLLGATSPNRQDWRQASQIANELILHDDTPVLMHTGFASARPAEGDPGSGLVLAPLAAYPIEGEIIHLPYQPNAPEAAALVQDLAATVAGHDRFVLIVSFKAWPYREALESTLRPNDFLSTHEHSSRHLDVYLFRRATR